jgi:hypothetical protein
MAKRRQQMKHEMTFQADVTFVYPYTLDDKVRYGDLFLVRLHDGRAVLAKNIYEYGLSLVDIKEEVDVDLYLNRKRNKALIVGKLCGFENVVFKSMQDTPVNDELKEVA